MIWYVNTAINPHQSNFFLQEMHLTQKPKLVKMQRMTELGMLTTEWDVCYYIPSLKAQGIYEKEKSEIF